MQVGSFGTIPFQCSRNEVHTFKNFSRKRVANFAEHGVLEQKSKLQFLGVSLAEISFLIQLSANFTDPVKRIDQFWKVQEEGDPLSLVIGGKNYGNFVLVDIVENQKKHGRKGSILFAELELSLKEYN